MPTATDLKRTRAAALLRKWREREEGAYTNDTVRAARRDVETLAADLGVKDADFEPYKDHQ